MSSVIVLSSPPKTFARSPTPVQSSSPLPSPRALLSQASEHTHKRFRPANAQRDGFSDGFSSARTLLGPKIGAENVPIRSPIIGKNALKTLSPKRFRSVSLVPQDRTATASKTATHEEDPIHDEDTVPAEVITTKTRAPSKALKRLSSASSATGAGRLTSLGPRKDTAKEDPFELPGSSPPEMVQASFRDRQVGSSSLGQPLSPLNIGMAVSRRTDWTPTKDAVVEVADESPSIGVSTSFSGGLIGDFGYIGDTPVITPASRHEIDTAPTKRRRIDMVETSMSYASSNMPPPKSAVAKKAKAAPKKALTITGLATSNYSGKDVAGPEPTPLDHFLSTQARALDAGHDNISSEIARVKAAKEQRTSKKAVKKSTLVSPTSAIRAFANQDAMFGSASQLARDESPSLTRDTLEAIRQSESNMLSSPMRTQETEHTSIESTTPRAAIGFSRFTKQRGLWSAAGRDEDNALLHVDIVDIDTFDSPDLREAFPGKDVLVQPSASRTREPRTLECEKKSPSLRGGALPHPHIDNLWNDDNMGNTDTPYVRTAVLGPSRVQSRTLHTTTRANSPRKAASIRPGTKIVPEDIDLINGESNAKPTALKATKKRTPKKPNFAGLTMEKLQKQIVSYGLKPIKQREHLIAVLDRCWDAKHTTTGPVLAAHNDSLVDEADDSLKHGDHLSNVHGLASRPIPKEKKAPKPRKPKELKEPKPRKKREPKATKEADPNKSTAVRKRKSKPVLSAEKVVDIDYIEDLEDPAHTSNLTEEAVTAMADAAIEKANLQRKPTKTTKPKTPTKVPSKARCKRTATPPATPSPAFATPVTAGKTVQAYGSPPPETAIDAQIELAITSYKPPQPTNHQKQPTWHEKILMYDPIVLEDLAAWLNTIGLGAIGEDREVSALEVREWCESRGICCLWRGGWRGNKAIKE